MSKRHSSVPVPVAVALGANGVDISDLKTISLSIASVGTATYKVMISYDGGTTFVQFGSNVTADTAVVLPDAATVVRVDCSAYTSGTPVGSVSGLRSNEDGR